VDRVGTILGIRRRCMLLCRWWQLLLYIEWLHVKANNCVRQCVVAAAADDDHQDDGHDSHSLEK